MSAIRTRIADHIAAVPGVHFNELVRQLDLAPGQVQHHVRTLRREDRIRREQLYGRTHYYPPGYDERERAAIALVRRETARDVLAHLLEHGLTRPATVAEDLDIARSTLEWHLDPLLERDLVRKERDRRDRVTLTLARPTETARLLDLVAPSIPDRMTNRFARLVDRLLEE